MIPFAYFDRHCLLSP